MTLEEIKAEMNRVKDKLDPLDLIELGWRDCIEWVLFDLLNQLEPSWHQYPEEKPTKDGHYMVTIADFERPIIAEYSREHGFTVWVVVAWMELPKPYKKEEE